MQRSGKQHSEKIDRKKENTRQLQREITQLKNTINYLKNSTRGLIVEQMSGGRSQQRESYLNTNQKERGKKKRRGSVRKKEKTKSVWYTLAEHLLSTGKSTSRRE